MRQPFVILAHHMHELALVALNYVNKYKFEGINTSQKTEWSEYESQKRAE